MKPTVRSELFQWIVLLGMFASVAFSWSQLPDRIPVHWNLADEVDRYGSKTEGLLMLPLITVAVYLLLLFLPRIDPGRANYDRFASVYAIIRSAVIAVLGAIHAVVLLMVSGKPVALGALMTIVVGILLIVLGSVMGKIRPNWFVGIRTPWTLSSKTSWVKTHRLGGWLSIGMGISLVAAGLIPSRSTMIGAGVLITTALIWMIVYSYFVWKDDPDRIPPAGTSPVEPPSLS